MKLAKALLTLGAALAAVVPAPLSASGAEPWWKHAVIYEIYPRSFMDSNGDGLGDLKGITSRLDHLARLGVDAIWISPCFPSPQADFGYDVSDYVDIDPMYGTLADFDELVAQARARGIRVVLDFVLNHSSDRHPWFLDARSSRTAAHHDWYVWHEGRGPGKPPSNWLSGFGGSAWTFVPEVGQYYYHNFEVQQPDLNWRNPAVRQAMFDVARFWFRRGVAGFRLDAVNTLFEDPELRDNPVKEGTNEFGDPNTDSLHTSELPENHQVLRDLRSQADTFGAVLIGETWTDDIQALKAYYGSAGDEIQLPMDFLFTTVPKLSAPDFRKQIATVESCGGWPVYVLSNHDIVRAVTRYGDGRHDAAIAKVLAAMLLTLRGTPILYYGEEVGMENHDPVRREDVKDPLGQAGWPQNKGRDGERTPMQWDASPGTGFTLGTPWLPVAPSASTRNVAAEDRDPDSILNFYRSLTVLRRGHAALLDGAYRAVAPADPAVLAYLRRMGRDAVLVALNMSGETRRVPLDPALRKLGRGGVRTLLSTRAGEGSRSLPAALELEPYGVRILGLVR